MSLMQKFNPKKIREEIPAKKAISEPKPKPASEIIPKNIEKLETKPTPKSVQQPLEFNSNLSYDLIDLSYFCVEHLTQIVHGPIEIKRLNIYKAYKDYIYKKMKIQSDKNSYFELKKGFLVLKLWRYKKNIFIPEEYLNVLPSIIKIKDIYDDIELVDEFSGLYVLTYIGDIIFKTKKELYLIGEKNRFCEEKKEYLDILKGNKNLDIPYADANSCKFCNFICQKRSNGDV